MLRAAREGYGLALVPERLAAGRLKSCLEAYSSYFPGFHLYYPSIIPAGYGLLPHFSLCWTFCASTDDRPGLVGFIEQLHPDPGFMS